MMLKKCIFYYVSEFHDPHNRQHKPNVAVSSMILKLFYLIIHYLNILSAYNTPVVLYFTLSSIAA